MEIRGDRRKMIKGNGNIAISGKARKFWISISQKETIVEKQQTRHISLQFHSFPNTLHIRKVVCIYFFIVAI